MMVLVSYDVRTQDKDGAARLRKVARVCRNYGQRAQYSVFEIEVEPAQWVLLRDKLCSLIDARQDSLRFYYLGSNWKQKVEHIGAKPVLDLQGPLVL
ncbi:CRISPR-associated endonuclease Cas2 [Chromobacterium sphagni]|uniref:CRISPR-associated endoribonuclease Cas2 n=1 Tax=Chromobacterium sphagni TaxID=1903179 RepID=A0ABX3CFQ8_9NEIS|nr:CRISPR-associated endonuclease Cas2 [Chromobacterium sphagni]OHX21157.1 CRISPR-associated endonuclease Cas2 [Chromobacterium sphagni]